MKRLLTLAVPALVLVGVLIGYNVLERRRTPDWEATLNAYLSRAVSQGDVITVLGVCEVGRPSNFTAEMGVPTHDGGTFESLELPFPPQALRCVLVEHGRASTAGTSQESTKQVIYVAYHSDKLWHMGWLVHEGPREPFTNHVRADLELIGCDLKLE